MVGKATLLALADSVKMAAGPDRDLDALIAPLQGYRIVDEGHPLGRCCYDTNGTLWAIPRFTASVDAAMTLIPVDQFWRLGNDGEGPDPADFKATVTSGSMPIAFHDVVAAAPALALTAAALRARASQEQPA